MSGTLFPPFCLLDQLLTKHWIRWKFQLRKKKISQLYISSTDATVWVTLGLLPSSWICQLNKFQKNGLPSSSLSQRMSSLGPMEACFSNCVSPLQNSVPQLLYFGKALKPFSTRSEREVCYVVVHSCNGDVFVSNETLLFLRVCTYQMGKCYFFIILTLLTKVGQIRHSQSPATRVNKQIVQ